MQRIWSACRGFCKLAVWFRPPSPFIATDKKLGRVSFPENKSFYPTADLSNLRVMAIGITTFMTVPNLYSSVGREMNGCIVAYPFIVSVKV